MRLVYNARPRTRCTPLRKKCEWLDVAKLLEVNFAVHAFRGYLGMLGKIIGAMFKLSERPRRSCATTKFEMPSTKSISARSIGFLGPMILNKVWPIVENKIQPGRSLEPAKFREILLSHYRQKLREE